MRVSFLAFGAGLILASLPTVTNARSDNDIFSHSLELVERGVTAQKAGELNQAIDYYEAALVADPRNRNAMIALAQIARVQGLPGKSIGLYREALMLEPNDMAALAGQGEALVDKGAVDKAKDRLEEARRLCAGSCSEITALERAISANAKKQMATADAPAAGSAIAPAVSQN